MEKWNAAVATIAAVSLAAVAVAVATKRDPGFPVC